MRDFFRPVGRDVPIWLTNILNSIRSALSDIWPTPLRLKDYATADLPTAADWAQGLAWDSTSVTVTWSDGIAWKQAQPLDPQLSAIAGLTPAANQIIYWTGATTAAMTSFTASARDFCDLNVVLGDIAIGTGTGNWNLLPTNVSPGRYLTSNSGGAPTWVQIDLTNGVTGDLPFSSLAQGSALSVLGVTGNATADFASIAAGSDHQVLRRSGTALTFGAVNLAQSAAVTGILPVANSDTGTSGTKLALLDGANTWSATQTFSVDASINGRAAGTGGQTNGTVFGGTVSAAAGTALGSGSAAAGSGTAIGRLANATTNAIAIGLSANADATNSLAIGHSADTATFASYCLGRASTSTANNQFVAGSDSTAITGVFFGRGVVSATTTAVTINGTGGSGTDIAGGNLTIAGGRCTGAGTEGKVIFSTAAAGASASTLRTLTQRAEITSTGFNLASGHTYLVNAVQVLKARITGWTVATGTAQRSGYATYTAASISSPPTQAEVQAIANGLQDVSRTLKALIDDLHGTAGHGLIGT